MKRKIYVVRQTSFKDCGPAALLSIIRFYGGNVHLETIKLKALTNINGTTAYNLLKVAREVGFDTAGYKLEYEDLLDKERIYPMICQTLVNNRLHFVTLYNIGNVVSIMDPAYGRRVLKKTEFKEIFTGNVLEVFPRSELVFMKKDNKLKSIVLSIINKEKNLLLKIIVVSAVYTFLLILSSYYFKIGVESLDKDIELFKYAVYIFFVITLFKSLIRYSKNKFELELNKNLSVYLYRDFLLHIFNLPSKIIKTKTLGEIVTRINDLNIIRSLFTEVLITFCLDFLLMLVAVLILYNISSTLFFVLTIFILLYFIVGILYKNLIERLVFESKEDETNFNSKIIEDITSLSSIKRYDKTNKFLIRLERVLSKYIFTSYRIESISSVYENLKYSLTTFCVYTIYTVGFSLIIDDGLEITDLIVFTTLMNFFLNPITKLIDNVPKIYYAKNNIFKLIEFMNIEKEEVGKYDCLDNFDLEFENVSFSYNGLALIIDDISIKIKHKKHVLFLGKSGCGKSTLCKLLLKEEESYNGNITVGGINLKDITVKTVRNNIVYVSQKEYLFSGTIRENIEVFETCNINKLSEICSVCKVDEILKNKVMRYETFIETDSNNFSGGEKQRIILARSLMLDFKILILDEALSEVDYDTEVSIIRAMKKYFKDKTIIYVSHKNLKKEFKEVINFDEF